MKSLAILLTSAMIALAGCAGNGYIEIFPPAEDCTVCDNIATGESLICDKIANPCAVNKSIRVTTKVGLLLAEIPYAEYQKWEADAEKAKQALGYSVKEWKDFLVAQIASLNKKAGAAAVILSEEITNLPDTAVFRPHDINLINMAWDNITGSINRMYTMMEREVQK